MSSEIGQRVGSLIDPGQQGAVAAAIGMTADAMSRAVRGQRGFAAVELARLADVLSADLHWLITGESDPLRVEVAARHHFDSATRERSVPGADDDRLVIDDIALAFHQVTGVTFPEFRPPRDVDDARGRLGPDFVRPFVERVEAEFGIGVVRVAELSTDYSFTIGSTGVIALTASGNWFRENWGLAHELGHLALGHLDVNISAESRKAHELAANRFAQQLLVPEDAIRAFDWSVMSAGEFADVVWSFGVSSTVIGNRLRDLGIEPSSEVQDLCSEVTQRVLRRHWTPTESGDPITERMDAAAARRFPAFLQDAHLDQIADGRIGKGALAWMLGVSADGLEVDQPAEPQELSVADLSAALGI